MDRNRKEFKYSYGAVGLGDGSGRRRSPSETRMYYQDDFRVRIRRNRSRSPSLSRDDSDDSASSRRSPSPQPQPYREYLDGSCTMRPQTSLLEGGEKSVKLLRNVKDVGVDLRRIRSSSPVTSSLGRPRNPGKFNETLEHQELSTDCTIMIQGLARDLTEDDIRHNLLVDGFVVKHIKLIRSRTVPGISKGVAFVEFHTRTDAASWMSLKTRGKFQSNLVDDKVIPEPPGGSDSKLVLTDWHCQNCKSPNFKLRENCFKCSAPREYREDLAPDDGATFSRSFRAPSNLEKKSTVAATAIAAARWANTVPVGGDDVEPSQQQIRTQNVSTATNAENCNRSGRFGLSDIDERNKWKKREEMEKVLEAERIAKIVHDMELQCSSNANQRKCEVANGKYNFENQAMGKGDDDDSSDDDDEPEYLVLPLAPLPYHFLPFEKLPLYLMHKMCNRYF